MPREAGTETLEDEARAIAQHLLDETAAAYEANDFSAFAPHFMLPGDVHTFGTARLISDLADLYDLFSRVRMFFDNIGMTSLERDCISAEFTNAETIKATHITRLLNGTTLIYPPSPAFTLFRKVEGRWKIASSQYATTEPGLDDAIGRTRKSP
ncbi:hypothetical protein [Vannielia litorea]|uniref:hypothetical protein n=1 Tax=Vannielia litorea TaxID=1217970 RepID=UPI001BCF7DF9|nr:hypothetical protein [Vannielia litorea]MBS8227652.1 hypothetical protein [Vannielia litorea]